MSLPSGRIHVVGAAGAGMSALAKLLVARGHTVSGSDLRGGPSLEALADLGMEVHTGHRPASVTGAALVVASSAVPDYDEELKEARRAGIEVWRRPQLLAAITGDQPTIAATGTHGKTTTTAMLVTALRGIGEDPSFVVGGELVELSTNGHHGEDDLLVLEADEAFRTFESLQLAALVITNVEHEHVDHFGSVAELETSFLTVASKVEGPVLACADDPGSRRVGAAAGALSYGTSDDVDWRVSEIATVGSGVGFIVSGRGKSARISLAQPGRHIALNATGAIGLLSELGRDFAAVATALQSFRGVGRRWEHRGTVAGVALYDDYAHHPTEVAAVLAAAEGAAPGRTWAVFQPHLYSRTQRFASEFGEALAKADVVVVTDVFGAREDPVPGVNGELVADAAAATGAEVHYVPHRADLAEFLSDQVKRGDLVVSLGAGDITLLHAELAPMLAVRA